MGAVHKELILSVKEAVVTVKKILIPAYSHALLISSIFGKAQWAYWVGGCESIFKVRFTDVLLFLLSAVYLSWVRNGLLMTVLGVSTRSPAADGDASLAVRMEENSVSIGQ